MLNKQTLYDIAKSRFEESKVLLSNNKPDGAVYLCGYALELILKWRIMKILEWDELPTNDAAYKSIKTHKLDILLKFAGIEKKVQADSSILAKWSIAKSWNSEIRYREIGKISDADAQATISATRDVINFIFKIT